MAVNIVSFSFSSGPQFNQGSREPLRPGVAFPTISRLQLALELNCPAFCSIRRPYITFKLPRSDMDTPPRLRNFFWYLAIRMCHFLYLWNGLCDRHRAEITVMQFRDHSLPVRQSMRVKMVFFFLPRPISSANFRPRDFLS